MLLPSRSIRLLNTSILDQCKSKHDIYNINKQKLRITAKIVELTISHNCDKSPTELGQVSCKLADSFSVVTDGVSLTSRHRLLYV